MDDDLTPTPQHQLKPRLEWVGKLLGMDLYIDTQFRSPKMRKVAEDLLSNIMDGERNE